jgi:hypothetical protein
MRPAGRIEYMRYFAHNMLFYRARVHYKVSGSGTKGKAISRFFLYKESNVFATVGKIISGIKNV